MLLSFELTMPGAASWNGRWSGEDDLHAKVINVGYSKKAEEAAQKLIDEGSFAYHWADGWTACVSVKQVSATQARNIRAKSNGFCGYDWMIESIRRHGVIKSATRPHT